jgi:hypothetical protein
MAGEATPTQTPAAAPAADPTPEAVEARSAPESAPNPAASLRITERNSEPPFVGLADELRAAGFPGHVAEPAVIDFDERHFAPEEFRAVTWSGSVDNINRDRQSPAAALSADQRYAWPVFTRVPVDRGVTSVDVPTQSARTLATPANTVRAIDAVTNKPEVASTVTIVSTPMKQMAAVESGLPNVYLESPVINSVIETDLRLSINDGLDSLIVTAVAASGFQAPGTDPLIVSVRKAMTTLMNAGYNPDTLLLTPAAAEGLDLAVSGISGGTQDFVFSPGQFAPNIWQLNRRISKGIAAPVVLDSRALGRLYTSPVSLARFEENAGKTNTSLVRMELHAVFGVERQAAAVRIAAS